MGAHIIDGEFQSDKYEWCLPGFVPLKLTDPMAQPFLWAYAEERRSIDAEFADDLQEVLRLNGYNGAKEKESNGVDSEPVSRVVRATCMAPTCAFNLLAFMGDLGTTLAQLDDAVRIHVLQTTDRIYVKDTRTSIIRCAEAGVK